MNARHTWWLVALVAVLGAALWTGVLAATPHVVRQAARLLDTVGDPPSSANPDGPVRPPGTYTSGPCPFREFGADPEVAFECGWLAVPERRDDAQTDRTVDIAVAVLRSRSATPRPDPVVHVSGGPGVGVLAEAPAWTWDPLLDERDLVLFDQRGTGYAHPQLACPAPIDSTRSARRCRQDLERRGVDLRGYRTASNAADLADLRVALGYETWNVYGSSYGSRIALTLIRDHPEGVRSVVLEGPYPPQVDAYAEAVEAGVAALDALFDACATDRACSAAHGDLRATFDRVVDEFDERPAKLPELDPATGREVAGHLDGADLARAVLLGLRDTDPIPSLPAWLDGLADGSRQPLHELVERWFAGGGWGRRVDGGAESDAVFYEIECAEEFASSEAADPAAVGTARGYAPSVLRTLEEVIVQTAEACTGWDPEPAPGAGEVVHSDVPVLVLAGALDPITPPWWGEEAARGLPSSQHFVFPGLGHRLLDAHDCPRSLTESFLADPVGRLDAGCVSAMTVPWLLP